MSRYPANIITKSPATPTGPTTTGRAPGVWRLDDVAYWIKQGVWPNANIQAPDTYFPYVSLLLSTTALGNANNNLFVDSSGAFNPISRNGNTTQGSFTPYGSFWSNYFDGSGDYLSVSNNAAFQFGTGDFTVECWINKPAAVNGSVVDVRSGGTGALPWAFYVDGNNFPYFYDGTSYTSSVAITNNSWNHIAVVRTSGTLKIFVNGVQGYSQAHSVSLNATGSLLIGGTAAYTTGYISNLRIVKGTAVYTANFTVPTAPLTAISGTSLLTCQSNRFRDASTNNFTITPNGNTSVTEYSPFAPAYPGISYNQSDIQYWSGYFDGSGDYLSAPSSAAFGLNGVDFTIEAWVYVTSSSEPYQAIVKVPGSGSSNLMFIDYSGGTNGVLSSQAGGTIATQSGVILNAWNHVAVVRSGTSVKCYVNGSGGTAQTIDPGSSGSVSLLVGYDGGSSPARYFNGYMSNLRVVKGTAVYTGNFTPSTTPLTAISGTSLLTCQNAAFTDNSANNFPITINGNTTVTGNNPFQAGLYSNYFDGNDYIQAPDNAAFAFGTGDYTIEAWVYPTSIRNGENLVYVTEVTQGTAFGYNQTQIYIGARGTAYDLLVNYTLPTNQWSHIAAARQSGTVRIFVNGALAGSGSVTRSCPQGPGTVGDYTGASNGNGVTGYISNVRVVKGTAVYTSAFTPPTAPLTAITNTSLLTCQSARFIDNSTNAFAITVNGNTSVQSFDPFYTSTIASNGGSMYFDGNADFLSIPNGPSVVLSGGAYTLEAWVYPTGDRSAYRTIFVKRAGDPTPCAWQLSLNTSTGTLIFYNGTLYNSGAVVPLNAWSHVAAVYDGTNINLYLNGSRVLQSATSNVDCNANAQIGYFFSSIQEPFLGYIANARIVKGTQVYSGTSYTLPTAPANPTPATTLLVNGMNAGIYDATAINDLETVGDAKVSTAVSKFGGSSMYFDGTGDYLFAPYANTLDFLTGDFTIECWVYFPSTGNTVFAAGWTTGEPVTGWSFGTDTTYGFYFVSAVSASYSTVASNTAARTLNTWHHVAVVRSSGNVTVYVNGVGGTSVSNTQNITTAATGLNIARSPYTSNPAHFTGYIDELRITRGYARYTSNFTPPTQAFSTY